MTGSTDLVVLVHGLGGSRLDMWPIARRLSKLNYQVVNWGYRSVGNEIKTHSHNLAKKIGSLESQHEPRKIHLVTHSMGGIIARKMFEEYSFSNIGKVVLLAPPNHGSHTARKLSPYLGWLSPSIAQLSDSAGSFVNSLRNSFLVKQIQFGIVESSKDRVIAPGTVLIDGYRDYLQVDGHHGILTWYRKTINSVINFLENGQFRSLRDLSS